MAGELSQLVPAWCPPGCLPCPSSWVLHLSALEDRERAAHSRSLIKEARPLRPWGPQRLLAGGEHSGARRGLRGQTPPALFLPRGPSHLSRPSRCLLKLLSQAAGCSLCRTVGH